MSNVEDGSNKPPRIKGARLVTPSNEVQVLMDLFLDKHKNHGLTELIKEWRILPFQPTSIAEYPCILVWAGNLGSAMSEYGLDNDEYLQFFWNFDIYCIVLEHQKLKYNGIVYEGALDTMFLLREIIMSILNENNDIESEDGRVVISNPVITTIAMQEGVGGVQDAFGIIISTRALLQLRRSF